MLTAVRSVLITSSLLSGQVNDGVVTDGIYWLTAFTAGPPEYVLGVDTKTGAVVFEQQPDNGGGNVVDMAYISKPVPSSSSSSSSSSTHT